MNEIETLESLLNELLSGIQEVMQSGEILTDQFQMVLAEELNYLTTRIDKLRASASVQTGTPELQEAMPSSNVSGFNYDDKTGKLYVQFLGKYPNRQGSVYEYDNVPKQIFELFRRGAIPARTKGSNRWGKWWEGKVPSIGASLYTLLAQSQYPYRRVS